MNSKSVHTQSGTVALAGSSERSQALTAATLAFVLGMALVFTTGFSHSATIHNAGHDTRHALSFPCH